MLAPAFVVCIFGLPLALLAAPAVAYPSPWIVLSILVASPLLYAVGFVLIAGVLSVPFQHAIVPGKFPRNQAHPLYRARRLYGLCWTSLYYFKPVYFLCLSLPFLKWLTFRLFGYRGQMAFTIHPDTWIRDLPLLDFGEGSYIANRAALGTNMCLSDGKILVDRIRIGRGAMVGHLALLAPGVSLGDGAEIGVGCGIGIGCRLGVGVVVQPCSAVNHLTEIGDGAVIGARTYVGPGSTIGPKVGIATAAIVPNRSSIREQVDADGLISSHVGELRRLAFHLQRLE